jgi:hypothetical protein
VRSLDLMVEQVVRVTIPAVVVVLAPSEEQMWAMEVRAGVTIF